jgi:ketosteroid isomerase-like protein
MHLPLSEQTVLCSCIQELLSAYARKDLAGVLAMFSPTDDVVVFGSDVSEVCASHQAIERLLGYDFQLWDSANFGEPYNLFLQLCEHLATAFFDATLTTRAQGQQRQFVIRFATIWRRAGQSWQLLQSLNTVPSIGQSAEGLVQQAAAGTTGVV